MKDSWSFLERAWHAGTISTPDCFRLIKILIAERDCMTENFKVTNQAYVALDRKLKSLEKPPFTISKHEMEAAER